MGVKWNIVIKGFVAMSLISRLGVEKEIVNDLSVRYWLRADEQYVEQSQEELVDEFALTEFVSNFYDGLHQLVCLAAALPY